jgi:lipoprotein-releasing system permease protein
MLALFTRRYLFTRKSARAINIISWVSIVAIAVGTAALLIVLSVFNGFSGFVEKLYNSLYTDVVVMPISGKFFDANDTLLQKIKAYPGTKGFSKVLEDNVLMQSDGAQHIVTLKGVDQNFAEMTGFNEYVKYGDSNLFNGESVMIGGMGVANTLKITEQNITPVSVFSIREDANLITSPQDALSEVPIYMTGIFSLQEELDNQFCITAYEKAAEVLAVENKLSSIAINLKPGFTAKDFKKVWKGELKSYNLKALSKQEQNKTLYYVLSSEKWMSYAILCFMLLIAAFNIIACMSMMVMEKKKDITIIKAMGGTSRLIRNIFLSTGMGIGVFGAVIGVVLAFIVLWTQQEFHWLKISNEGGLLLNYYPVAMRALDFVAVIGTVIVISFLAAWVPAAKAGKM